MDMKKGITALIGLVLLVSLLPLTACQSISADNFVVQSLNIRPNKVMENDKFTATAVINNAGNDESTYLVQVWVNGIVEGKTTVMLEPGTSKEVPFMLHSGEAGTYEIKIGDKSTSVVVEKLIPAEFEVSDFKLNTKVASPGEEVIITARISNKGGSKGSYVAKLTVNGVVEQTDQAVMEPGASYNAVFKVKETEPGTYIVGIGDITGKYFVQKPVETVTMPQPTPAQNWGQSPAST